MYRFKEKILKIIQILDNNDVELIALIGASFLTYAGFLVHEILGFYTVGALCMLLVIILLKNPKK